MSSKVAIIDYGMGNLHSVKKKLNKLKVDSVVTSNVKDIQESDRIILPGVGHFEKAIESLDRLGLINVLNEEVLVKRKPILGICLGMQIMAKSSEEGNVKGLGWIDANVIRFNIIDKLKHKVPHMGWNQIAISKPSKLMAGVADNDEFYFVHSYHYLCNNHHDVLNTTKFEYEFVSAIEKDNIYGVQYHPEKSHDVGELLLKNFINL
jgi:imidazole glycerol-phosphate synthase subunit HisH